MNAQNCTVKDMLINGIDPQELINSLQKEIADAQAQIAAEQAPTQTVDLDEIRMELADLFIDYIEALEVVPVEMIDEITTEDVVEMLKELEEQIKAYAHLTFMLSELKKSKPAPKVKTATISCPEMNIDDKIIRDFLKSLK